VAVPLSDPVATVRLILKAYISSPFADDRPLLSAPARDIDCLSSILGSGIECAEIAKCCTSSSSRLSVYLTKADHHLMSAGAARFAKAGSLNQNLVGIGGLRTHVRTLPGESPIRLLGSFFGINDGSAI
jgi:hypothetical protein